MEVIFNFQNENCWTWFKHGVAKKSNIHTQKYVYDRELSCAMIQKKNITIDTKNHNNNQWILWQDKYNTIYNVIKYKTLDQFW